MNYGRWFAVRGPRFILQRGARLVRRYGLSSDVAVDRILGCLDTLARFGCAPTFPTPGVVAQRYPEVIRRIQDAGAEIAVHSYHHVDLSALSLPAAVAQLARAVETFERLGIDVRGFRCPYLGWSDQLLNSLPPGMFEYSSNEAVRFEPDNSSAAAGGEFYSKLEGFYRGKAFSDTVCLPSTRPNFIEIPACVPDDLQLHDGLGLGPEGIADVWGEMFDQIHGRGELFTLLFHPELGAFCEAAFATLLGRASRSSVPVWFPRLRDVSEWWREKAAFRVEAGETDAGLRLSFDCSPPRHGTCERLAKRDFGAAVGWGVLPDQGSYPHHRPRPAPVCRRASLRFSSNHGLPPRAGLSRGNRRFRAPVRHLP